MKTKSLLMAISATFLVLTATVASAQELELFGGNQVNIPDGSTVPSQLNETDFGQVSTGNGKVVTLFVSARDENSINRTGPITVTGANASDFTVYYPYGLNFPIEQNGYFPLQITFAPGGAGLRTATITFPTNIPGPQSEYTFAVQGEGVNGSPISTADLDVPDLDVYPKSKQNKKTGQFKVTWGVSVYNIGSVISDSSIIAFYVSDDETLSDDDQLLSTVPVKTLKPAIPGKKLKGKKVKFKALLPQSNGYLFAVATNFPLFPSEANQANNVNVESYYTEK